ncbi:MAG: type IV pilus assembly protein PilM [Bdellovibrionales bacterium]|nr:type IV pilus assembly protein PilM [Bdellovibrionales bacterium]
MFGRSKNLVGLDIGSSSVKLVELKSGKNGYELVHFRMAPLPPEAIVDGAIMNSSAVVDALVDIITSEKLKTKQVATSVSGNSVIVKKIKLPQMTPEELEESIQWEAEQYIPFDIGDVNLDVHILGLDEHNVDQMEVILVAAKKDMINDYMAVIMEAGLSPQVMDVDVFALGNAFEMSYALDESSVTVLANIGANVINVNVMKGFQSTFTRDISIGGNQYTEEIQKQLSVSFEQAEALKIGGDPEGDLESSSTVIPQEVGTIIRSVSESIATEVQRSLDFYAAGSSDDKIAKIYLMGGSSKIIGLASVVENKTGISTEIANPFKEVFIDEKKFNVAHIQDVAPSAAVAVGLALRKMGDK